jgi:uncharacterized protein (TIGR02246 family)
MQSRIDQATDLHPDDEKAIRALYERLLESWNSRNSDAYAAEFTKDANVIGFDGSEMIGRAEVASIIGQIFADHLTGRYVGQVRSVKLLAPDVAILRAAAGIVPHGRSDLVPDLNSQQTLITTRHDGQWRIALFQNTPAQFHGRPELVQQMTEELRQLL